MRRNDHGNIVGSPNSIEGKVTGTKKLQSKRWKRRSRSCIARTFTFLRLVWLYRAGWWSKVQRVSSLVYVAVNEIHTTRIIVASSPSCSWKPTCVDLACVPRLFFSFSSGFSLSHLSLSFCLSFISLVLSGASRLAPHGCPHPEFRVNRH